MKHRLIAAICAVVVMAANISAVPMPVNTSAASDRSPDKGSREIATPVCRLVRNDTNFNAEPVGEHWSASEKRCNDVAYVIERAVKDAGTYDYPSVGCADSSPDKGSQEIATPSCATVRNDKDLSADGKGTDISAPYEGEEFVATAYCPCAKCCGKYAYNRPVDEDGEPIVYTSTGVRATQGRTIAVDPTVIPYGTHVLINGVEYVAEDCGGNIKGRRIDVYFADHAEADAFGRQTVTVVQLGANK